MKMNHKENAQTTMTDEIIVDNFAGGGVASTGIELATGRVVIIAINHSPDTILMHRTNHPYTERPRADRRRLLSADNEKEELIERVAV